MTLNLFESAIVDNEENEFFRGHGKYLVPSQDYDGHLHGAHMGGHARTYAELSTDHSKRFDEAFLNFMKSLEVNEEDLTHLLANMSSYFGQKSRGGFPESSIFNDKTSLGSRILRDYMVKIYRAKFLKEAQDKILRHAEFIRKKGSTILMETIEDLQMV